MTEFVVDELALLPYSADNLQFRWPEEPTPRANRNVYLSPTVPGEIAEAIRERQHAVRQLEPAAAMRELLDRQAAASPDMPLARYDLACVTTPEEVDAVIRPLGRTEEPSLLRPRGAVLLVSAAASPGPAEGIDRWVSGGIEVRSSRCGDLARALDLLAANADVAGAIRAHLISTTYPLGELPAAFEAATQRANIKVLVDASAP